MMSEPWRGSAVAFRNLATFLVPFELRSVSWKLPGPFARAHNVRVQCVIPPRRGLVFCRVENTGSGLASLQAVGWSEKGVLHTSFGGSIFLCAEDWWLWKADGGETCVDFEPKSG